MKSTGCLINLSDTYVSSRGISNNVEVQLHTLLFSLPYYPTEQPLLLDLTQPLPSGLSILKITTALSFEIIDNQFYLLVEEANDSYQSRVSSINSSIIRQVIDSFGEVLWTAI